MRKRSSNKKKDYLYKKPAVFLDRDGVLTIEKGCICPIDEVEIFSYAAECVKAIHKKGYWAIVVTNQSGIARGLFTEDELLTVHDKIKKETGVDAIYYCPHFIEGKIKKYTVACQCRKPEIGMIKQACKDFDIDIKKSYIVGDRGGDILMGQKAGMKTVLVTSCYYREILSKGIKVDYVMKDLPEFVKNLE